MLIPTPEIGRRRFIASGLASAGAVLLPHGLHAQESLVPTPQQTAGPFYPVQFPEDIDNDEAHASGVVTHVMGRVLGTDGKPIPNPRLRSGSATPTGATCTRPIPASGRAIQLFRAMGA